MLYAGLLVWAIISLRHMPVSATMPDMRGVPFNLSFAKPLARIPSPPHDKICLVIACLIFGLMGVVFHILSEPESPRQLFTYIGKTPLGREIGWLWRKFWGWGSLAWIIFGVLFPVGSGVAAVERMYTVARCFVAGGCILLVIKVIDYALTEEKPKKTRNEITWASVITIALGSLAAWGCFSFIDVIDGITKW
jgi:hypothetical protein